MLQLCLSKENVIRDHLPKAKNKPLSYSGGAPGCLVWFVVGSSLTGSGWLRLVPLLLSVSGDAQCVSRTPVLLELEIWCLQEGTEPLRVTEDPSVCPQRGQSSVLMLSSGSCHQCCDGAEADGCCFGRGCSRCQQHIQGTLQAIVLTLHTAMSRLGWP